MRWSSWTAEELEEDRRMHAEEAAVAADWDAFNHRWSKRLTRELGLTERRGKQLGVRELIDEVATYDKAIHPRIYPPFGIARQFVEAPSRRLKATWTIDLNEPFVSLRIPGR